ncbi:MAG: cyclopropane-fatty-acyl-phospholipid synthase family protein [Acidimicrobiia bacterium]
MLNNLVNRHDMVRVRTKLVNRDVPSLLRKLRGSASDRVVRQWSDVSPDACQWWSIPAVRRRWNHLVTGSEHVDFPAYVTERHLGGGSSRSALSLGCGLGGRELRWAELGAFGHIDAFDISAVQVEEAKRRAELTGQGERITFSVADFTTLAHECRFDVVIAEHSLHHLAPMPEVVAKVWELLVPGGLFVVDEYVGPQRFQWTETQLDAAQELLERFPARYRRTLDGGAKASVVRPSKLWMRLTDPSEAIDSARIGQSLHQCFDVIEDRPYGGAVLHLALADIAHNFLDSTEETAQVLRDAFEFEDRLMVAGAVGSDFAAYVCRKPVAA